MRACSVVSLTAAGNQQLRRLEKQLAATQDEPLAPLSADEREQLAALLTKLLQHHSTQAASRGRDRSEGDAEEGGGIG